MGNKGVFVKHMKSNISFENQPNSLDRIWMNPETKIIYKYDSNRGKWLSTNKDVFEFARKGAANGMHLPLLGDLDDVDDVYMTGTNATITSIFCRSKAGFDYKSFEIRKNSDLLFEFGYSGSRLYINKSLNLDVDEYDEIQVYVKQSGPTVINTVCRLDINWRYDV
jgi:hypothetical protein